MRWNNGWMGNRYQLKEKTEKEVCPRTLRRFDDAEDHRRRTEKKNIVARRPRPFKAGVVAKEDRRKKKGENLSVSTKSVR